jgi:transposase-like protein
MLPLLTHYSTALRTSGVCKDQVQSYYGVSREHFYFYLKEMEFRFNHRKVADLQALIKKIVRKQNAFLD